MVQPSLVATLGVLLALSLCGHALNNGLGLTPQMGYCSWMDTSSDVTESRIKETADAFIELGLAKLGYHYINVDEGWLKGRYSNGTIYSDNVKFPSGMKALGDYIHSKGLKYGLYTCRGTSQCGTSQYGAPGSYGYYKQDMAIMASWGMDYVKVDSCSASQDHQVAFQQYGEIRDAINATGRSVFFSLCGWNPWYAPVGYSLGNSWRIDGDGDNWGRLTIAINTMASVGQYARPGGWNDPDLLIGTGAGSYGPDRGGWYQSDLQSRSQFSMWCLFPAPLLISADVRSVSQYALETWSNPEAIAVNQDKGRFPEFPHTAMRLVGSDLGSNSGTNVWGRALSDGSFAVVFLNNFGTPQNIVCDASCFSQMKFAATASLNVRDLWTRTNIGRITPQQGFTAKNVPGNGGCTFIKFSLG